MATDTMLRRIVLVDDDRIVLEGLKQLFDYEEGLEVCGTATSAEDAIEVVRRSTPDAVVVDLILGEGPDGIQLTKLLKTLAPATPVLMLSGHDESLFAERALEAGASGYLMKDEAVDALFAAIRRVLAGGIWLSDTVWGQLGGDIRTVPLIEIAPLACCVLVELRAGNRTSHGIAAKLGVDERAVLGTLEAVRSRTGLKTVVQLALYAEHHDIRCSH